MVLRNLAEETIAELQRLMEAGELSAQELVGVYLDRYRSIDQSGPAINSIIEINPDAQDIAAELDRERQQSGPRGPLHGIPILLKDNVDTADRMSTSAGSLALASSHPARDAFVARRLRKAGAVLLGKTNMSEWANFRGSRSTSGWSGRGGQARNPHVLDRSPSGSSSGSASAVAAGLAVASLGTETDGSILSPASANGVVGIKPTVGLTSRSGVVPIAHSQDTVGPFGRCVADAAAVLDAIAGARPRLPAGKQSGKFPASVYAGALDLDGLRGARIGVARDVYFGYSAKADSIAEAALATMKKLGAEIIDPANIPTAHEMKETGTELEVLLYEFKTDLNAYLAQLGPDSPVHSLEDVISFNEEHAEQELAYIGQERLEKAKEKGPLTDHEYLQALDMNHRLARRNGIDAVMDELHLDAFTAGGGQVLADVVGPDRQLAVAAVGEHGELHAVWPAVVEQRLDRRAHRAPGVEDVIDDDDRQP